MPEDTNNQVQVLIAEYSAMRSEIIQLSTKQQQLLIFSFAVSGYAFTQIVTSDRIVTSDKSAVQTVSTTTPIPTPDKVAATALPAPQPAALPAASSRATIKNTSRSGLHQAPNTPASATSLITTSTVTPVVVSETKTSTTVTPDTPQEATTKKLDNGVLCLLLCLVLCALGLLFIDLDRAIIRCATYIENHLKKFLKELTHDTGVNLLEWEIYVRGISHAPHLKDKFPHQPWNVFFQGALIGVPASVCLVTFFIYDIASKPIYSGRFALLIAGFLSVGLFWYKLSVAANHKIPLPADSK